MVMVMCLMATLTNPSRCARCGAPVVAGRPCCVAMQWEADKHPRAKNGRFGSGSGGQAAASGGGHHADPVIDGVLSKYFSGDELDALPRIVVATRVPDGATTDMEGYSVPGYGAVYVGNWSDAYRAAQGGNAEAQMKLAGVIAHEAWHVKNGTDESGAYDAEINKLRRIGAPNSMIDGVRRSARAAARGKR